jgi:ferredoxin
MASIENEIKTIARENGAVLVGIASRERLNDAPPSADPEYLLPSTCSIISIAIPYDRNTLRDYFSKKDWLSCSADEKKKTRMQFSIGDRLVDYLQNKGFDSLTVDTNLIYRPEPGIKGITEMSAMIPDFSHRYGALAAGLGRLGWSGNLMTPQFGSAVLLGTVLTSAELEPDPLLEDNPCDRCKLCTSVCPVEMMSVKESIKVTVAGITEEIARKRTNNCCFIGCSDYHGLAPNRKWSNWSPYRVDYPLPKDDAEVDDLCTGIRKADPEMSFDDSMQTGYRELAFSTDHKYLFTNVCGNCAFICWKKREHREDNRKRLVNSSTVVLTASGERIAAPKQEEVIEVQTHFKLRVAVLRKEYEQAETGKISKETNEGHNPRDKEVLTTLFKKSRD